MAAFSDVSFDTSAFSVGAFDFGGGPPPAPPPTTQLIGGGIPFQGRLHVRTRADRRKDRAKFGLFDGLPDEIAEVVASVAARQAENLVLDEQKRYEELTREITLRGLEFEARYLEAMNKERQRLIDEEIGTLLKKKLDEEVIVMLLVMAACV